MASYSRRKDVTVFTVDRFLLCLVTAFALKQHASATSFGQRRSHPSHHRSSARMPASFHAGDRLAAVDQADSTKNPQLFPQRQAPGPGKLREQLAEAAKLIGRWEKAENEQRSQRAPIQRGLDRQMSKGSQTTVRNSGIPSDRTKRNGIGEGSMKLGRTNRRHSRRDAPRSEWSCCRLGVLAARKGFHCQAQYYARIIWSRNYNRIHTNVTHFHDDKQKSDYGVSLMTLFSRCDGVKSVEFHTCCYSVIARKEENRILWGRRKGVAGSPILSVWRQRRIRRKRIRQELMRRRPVKGALHFLRRFS